MKRTLLFESACRLSVKNRQLVVLNVESGEENKIPIEDIGMVVLEIQMSSITVPVFVSLIENNASVVLCDSKHMPCSILWALDSNTTQAEAYRSQTEMHDSLRNRLWKQIVEAKIRNQSLLLSEFGKDGARLKPFYMNVKNGDSSNREGAAANIYWDELFGTSFTRGRHDDIVNTLLNYGYSVLRAAMARAIMCSGLFPAFGIFHKNRYNAFPLADDLMEPYRPYVDQVVVRLLQEGVTTLDRTAKCAHVCIMQNDTKIADTIKPLALALSVTTASFRRCAERKDKDLVLPAFR